jgi:hypothetical protein
VTRIDLHPARLLPADPSRRDVARRLYQEVRGLPIVSPHGHVDPALLLDDEPLEVGDALVEGQARHGLVSELGVEAHHVGVFELIDEGKRIADGWEQEVATRFVGLGLERDAQLIALLDGVVAQQVHGLGVAIEGSANRLGGVHLAALPATPEYEDLGAELDGGGCLLDGEPPWPRSCRTRDSAGCQGDNARAGPPRCAGRRRE